MAVCPSGLQIAEPAEYISGTGSVQHANGIPLWHKLAFYKIGWQSTSKKPGHTKEGLAKEICDMVQELTLDAVGITEVYNLKEDDKHDERQIILRHLLSSLSSSPAQPAWEGRSDGHYISYGVPISLFSTIMSLSASE